MNNESIVALWEAHECLGKLNDEEREAFVVWLSYERGTDILEVTEDDIDAFRDAYCGQYESEVDFAEKLIAEMGLLSQADELFSLYFDYEAFARDLFMSDYYMTENGYVFLHIIC